MFVKDQVILESEARHAIRKITFKMQNINSHIDNSDNIIEAHKLHEEKSKYIILVKKLTEIINLYHHIEDFELSSINGTKSRNRENSESTKDKIDKLSLNIIIYCEENGFTLT